MRRCGGAFGAAGVGCVAVLLLASPAPVRADFADDYRDGVAALERGDAAAAIRLLRRAIEERPEESARLPRLFFRRYTPYFHLGVALAESGDCRAALGAFAESQRQGVIQRFDDDLAELARRRDRCAERRERVDSRQRAEEAVARAAEAAAAVAELAARPELESVWEWRESSLAARSRSANELLAAARRVVEVPDEASPEALDAARDQAQRAYWQLEAVRAEAAQHLVEIRALRAREREDLAETVYAARRSLRQSDRLAPFPPLLAQRRAELDRLIAAASVEVVPAAEAQRLGQAIERAVRALEVAAEPPPAALRRAADRFLAGEYEATLEGLAGFRSGAPRAMAQAHLLRAASRFALARRGVEPTLLLALAAADLDAARRADPDLALPAAYLSPAFRDFAASPPSPWPEPPPAE